MSYHRQGITIALLVALFAGSFYWGLTIGREQGPEIDRVVELTGKEEGKPATVDFSPFWKAWNVINEKYAATEKNSTDQEKVWGAIKGLVGSLGDPYSVFFTPKEAALFQSDISGQFQGVGMEIGVRDDALTVIAPLKDTPAARAGIRSGDKILKIDGKVSIDMNVDEAVQLIRGPKGSEVVLTILHEGASDSSDVTIVRDVITIPTIDTELRDSAVPGGGGTAAQPPDTGDVFVIKLYNFSANSPTIFRDSLRDFVLSGKHKLLLDLRGNPGGYLEAAVDMASWFLPVGKVIVREDSGRESESTVFRSRGYNIFNDTLRMVILVDGGTASASEILAGALSEHGVAKLVGTQTFGKGSVQELVPITDDTSLKITIARWLTPNGISLSENGLTPDVVVETTRDDIDAGRDPQLDAALELLKD